MKELLIRAAEISRMLAMGSSRFVGNCCRTGVQNSARGA